MPTRAIYAGSHLGTLNPPGMLISGEPAVLDAAPEGVDRVVPDLDADLAERINVAAWQLAATWGTLPVDGVDAVDIGCSEAALSVLLPAARGVLEIQAALATATVDELLVVEPADGTPKYKAYERLVAAGAEAAAVAAIGRDAVRRQPVADPRNAVLVAKYRAVRDPDDLLLVPSTRTRLLRGAACLLVNAAAGGRGRDRLLVLQYGSTGAFARRHARIDGARDQLVRGRFAPSDVPNMLRGRERGFMLPSPRGRPVEAAATLRATFEVGGIDLTPIVLGPLQALAGRYAAWLDGRVARVRRRLRRERVRAVLVPFDTVPEARMLVRCAALEDIPAYVLNDGWKGDDFQLEGLTAAHALALSEGMRDDYLVRRGDARPAPVTGDPRTDERAAGPARRARSQELRRVLVGSFTFSPIDLNCRRGDGERFMADVLAGIRASAAARDAHVVVKLHPADEPGAYAGVLRDHPGVEVVGTGDVLTMLDDADVYVTTYSTSLLQAAVAGIPIVYHRVNEQRLHAPFSPHDPVMRPRTTTTAAELAALLDDPSRLRAEVPDAWLERHVGPRDGRCSERVLAALSPAGRR